MPNYGSKRYTSHLNDKQSASANFIMPMMTDAIKQAEGSDKYVKSFDTDNPEKVLKDSIMNNFSRWIMARQHELPDSEMPKGASAMDKFVDFMQKRWAPIGVPNDPENKNANWAPNVRKILKELLGQDEYDRWHKYDMVKAKQGDIYA